MPKQLTTHPFWSAVAPDIGVSAHLATPLKGEHRGELIVLVDVQGDTYAIPVSPAGLAQMAAGIQGAYELLSLGIDAYVTKGTLKGSPKSDCAHERVGSRCGKCGERL